MSPSSTSSSEVVAAIWRSLPVFGIALCMVLMAEGAARFAIGDDSSWRMWSRTTAAKERLLKRRIQQDAAPDLLIVGDSSAAFNIFPPVLDKELGIKSFNFGTPGNYPRAFDHVMTHGLLTELDPPPAQMLVSFASISFDPSRNGQTATVLASPLAKAAQGEHVWADHSALVRLHHYLRLRREPPVNPTVFRMGGFEPYHEALQRRRRQPRLAAALPPVPAFFASPTPTTPSGPSPEELTPLRGLFEWAATRNVRVTFVSPPADEPQLMGEISTLCAEFGIRHLDYSDAPLPHHNSHLSAKDARIYTARIAQDMKD